MNTEMVVLWFFFCALAMGGWYLATRNEIKCAARDAEMYRREGKQEQYERLIAQYHSLKEKRAKAFLQIPVIVGFLCFINYAFFPFA